MRTIAELGLVLLLATAGAVGTWKIAGPPDRSVPCDPKQISPDEVCLATVKAEWGDVLWIDARSEADWKRDGLEGSIHITTMGQVPFDQQIEANMEAIMKGHKAVVYCNGVKCTVSKETARQLRDFGMLPEVKALHGGYDALNAAGMIKLRGSSPAN
ncbi:rhodanese-like domain-containing protein [Haloferula sp. BvORR071]|uniref:rhodanese-like domain-containing protein n=1 Tax=Haloferula sp. BvORR071 TaxID=1396141 RepID=UPI000552538C|nr:rhodanese-like domain-containing protein [Haloferula sp. BvORR071]